MIPQMDIGSRTVTECPSEYSPRCPACPGKHNCVPFSGPENNQYMFLGEAPGHLENSKGMPFVGPTGREVNEGYLPLAGLKRDNLRFGNVIGCLPSTPQNKLDMSKSAHRELAQICFKHRVEPELRRLKPSLIVTMGAFAAYCLDPTMDLEIHHGIPKDTEYGLVFPMGHPARGIHEPKQMLHIRTDWSRLRKLIRGTLEVAYDEYEGREDYGVIEDPYEIDEDMADMYDHPLACDTENTKKKEPFCLTYSTRPGRARLIKASNTAALKRFQYHVDRWKYYILWHNWIHDETITNKMGLKFPRHWVTDTMVRVFNLGNMPQGLKAISFREMGMKMMDFDDLVSPHSKVRVINFFRDAWSEEWTKPAPFQYRDADGELKTKQPQSMSTKFKRFFTDLSKDPDKNVFEMWTKNWVADQDAMEEKVGREYPSKCITHAAEEDWESVVFYANRDADSLRRFWPILRNMESNVRRAPQENWRDMLYAN